MDLASMGAFSIIERYSSPWSLPDAIACVSWYMAFALSLVLAPETLKAFCIVSAKYISSLLFLNASPAKSPSFAVVCAIDEYSARLLWAAAKIWF